MTSSAKPTEAVPAPSKTDADPSHHKHHRHRGDGYREMIESIVVAFVLAFLFRTFEAEAFVIPTGSMAPTLMGRHKEISCPQCHYIYPVSASEEVDEDGKVKQDGQRPMQVVESTCPNCRYKDDDVSGQPSFKGDRILVLKFPYTLDEPERWDVMVFKFPEQPSVNYIKRVVGLPGEEVRIYWGDIYVRPLNSEAEWQIAQAAEKQKVLQMLVYDNDHQPNKLRAAGWPDRWQPDPPETWSDKDEGREFVAKAEGSDWNWLRYHHLVPSPEQWDDAVAGKPLALPPGEPRPQLITDFYGYNSGVTDPPDGFDITSSADRLGAHWVGDLTVSFEVELLQSGGELACELVEGRRRFRVLFNLTTGEASLWLQRESDAEPQMLGKESTLLTGTGTHQLSFANVDDRMTVWVDGEVAPFGKIAEFEPPPQDARGPTPADLVPVNIGCRNARLAVRHVKLDRDVYYVAYPSRDYGGPSGAEGLARFLSSPELWGEFNEVRAKVFDVPPGNYFVLGDNSPRSRDSRLWNQGKGNTVDEQLLIGQAFFVYWPHGVPLSFSTELNFWKFRGIQFPFRPYFERMKLIR